MADNHAGPISGPQTGPQAGSQTGQQDITDYCRSCKASIADQKQIRVVTEWCCACVTKLIKNHRHLCEFDFAGKKSQCLHCREGNFSNAGKNPKPCVGVSTRSALIPSPRPPSAERTVWLQRCHLLTDADWNHSHLLHTNLRRLT